METCYVQSSSTKGIAARSQNIASPISPYRLLRSKPPTTCQKWRVGVELRKSPAVQCMPLPRTSPTFLIRSRGQAWGMPSLLPDMSTVVMFQTPTMASSLIGRCAMAKAAIGVADVPMNSTFNAHREKACNIVAKGLWHCVHMYKLVIMIPACCSTLLIVLVACTYWGTSI